MNIHVNINSKNTYDVVENEPCVNIENNIQTIEVKKQYVHNNTDIALYDEVNVSNHISSSLEHIYEEVNYTKDHSTSTLKTAKKKIFTTYETIKNKITKKNSKDFKYYDKQKKDLKCNNDTTDNNFKKQITLFKNKYFSKNKTNLQDIEQSRYKSNSRFYNVAGNDYGVTTNYITTNQRLVDESGYEIPVCQQKQYLLSMKPKKKSIKKYLTSKRSKINSNNFKGKSATLELTNSNERLVDESGYEIPACQQKQYLLPMQPKKKSIKKYMTSKRSKINSSNFKEKNATLELTNSNENNTDKLQAKSATVLKRTPQDSKIASTTDNKNNTLSDDLRGIVQKRKSMFEQLHNKNN